MNVEHKTILIYHIYFLYYFTTSVFSVESIIFFVQDTLRECTLEDKHCLSYLPWVSPIYFVTFVLMAQFVLVNVVVAVLMKHLEESNKEAKEDAEMDAEIEMEMEMGRRLSNISAMSSGGQEGRGTYMGTRPHSPGQVCDNICLNDSVLAWGALEALWVCIKKQHHAQ